MNVLEATGQAATRVERRAALLIAIIVAVLAGAWSVADHFAFGTDAFDSGVIDHALWRVTHGFDDVSTLNGQPLFADHPSPVLLLVLPVYFVEPAWGLPVYFALRSVSVGMVVWAAWLLAAGLGLRRSSRWILVISAVVGPGLVLIVISEASAVSLAVGPLALATALGLVGGSTVWFGVLVGVAASARPEIALGVLVLGVILRQRSLAHARIAIWIGAIFAVGGVAWLVAAGDAAGFSGHLGHLGDSFGDAMIGALRRPWDAIAPLFHLQPWLSLVVWLGGFGLIAPLLGSRWLLPAVPLLAIPFLGTWENADDYIWQYWQVLLPLGMVASAMALSGRRVSADRFRQTVVVLVPVVWLVAVIPVAPDLIPVRSARGDAAAEVIQTIDATGYESVSAPGLMVPHLTQRRAVHSFPFPFVCGEVVAGYRSPDRLPEAVVLLDEQTAEWFSRLSALGYRKSADEGRLQVWVNGTPPAAPALDCD